MSEELTFRRAQKEDLSRVSEFRKNSFGDDSVRRHGPKHYEWRCYGGPQGEGDLWIAEDGDRVVGMQIATLKGMKMLGRIITGAKTGDSFTHPEYQRRGISTTLAKLARDSALEKEASLLYTTPNRNSLPVWKGAGYENLTSVKVHSMVKPLNIKKAIELKLRSSLLATILSPITEILFRTMLKLGTIRIGGEDFLVSQVSSFPDNIDALWARASGNYDVMLVRNKEFLEWRYVKAPDEHLILIARGKGGKVLGYIVGIIPEQEQDWRTGFIADFLTLEDDPGVFRKLVLALTELFYKNKAEAVFTQSVKGSFYDRVLLRLGFSPRDTIPLLCYKNELGSQLLSGAYKWHFTMGDSDNI